MSSLGELFSPEIRAKLATDNLKAGSVLRIPVRDTNPPKIKYLIIDYPHVKRRARNAEIAAIVMIFLTIASLIVAYMQYSKLK